VESPRTLVHVPEAAHRPARRRITGPGEEPGPDELVLGRYRLLEQLGAGGFGVVWRAQDELLRREVAVKRVFLGEPPIDSERATREALATARLSHPAIVSLYEACAVDDAFYLISELVDGDTLATLIAEDSLEDEEILEIALALAGALSHAHARGVIHRDIKPQNVLVPHQPDAAVTPRTLLAAAKLTDFGGASLVGEDALTRTGDVLGTLAYMAPEQSEGREVGAEADLYSLALVIYEALSGTNPVRGATPAATVRRIGRRVTPLERERRDLSPALTRALDRALAPSPRDRGTLEELRLVLVEVLEHGSRRPRWRRRLRSAQEPRALERLGEEEHASPPRRIRLPRALWLACAAMLIAWQAFAGRPGVALLAFAALLALAILPADGGGSRVGVGWLSCALAPLLGLAGLAGAFPAIAGQARGWRERASLAALGYWWLALAGPLLDRRLWLTLPSGIPARAAWEASLGLTASHVIAPQLTLGVLLGALLWAAGATVLPWIVRGRSAALDIVAVAVWSIAIAIASPALDSGLSAHASHPDARGAVRGAILGGVVAVAARALRGPV
jgi:hypothetical protein